MKLHTENFICPNGRIFCYNDRVPQKWDALIFDMGFLVAKTGQTCFRKRGTTSPTSWTRSCPQPPPSRGQNLREGRACRDRKVGRVAPRPPTVPEELWKRIRRLQHVRNSVLCLVAKPLTFHNENPNTMVRRVSFTRRILFSCFSLRFLAAPATRRNSEGAPLFFRAEAAALKLT